MIQDPSEYGPNEFNMTVLQPGYIGKADRYLNPEAWDVDYESIFGVIFIGYPPTALDALKRWGSL